MNSYRYQQRRLDRKRKARLMTKIQKARALDHIEDVLRLQSWRKRFGMVVRLRAEGNQ